MATKAADAGEMTAPGLGGVAFQTSGPKKGVPETERVKHHIYSNPPEPSLPEAVARNFTYMQQGFNGVSVFVNTWIDKFPTDYQKNGAMDPVDLRHPMLEVAKAIRLISFDDFLTQLRVSYDDTKRQLDSLYEGGFKPERDAITLVEGRKSNKWVAELALKRFGVSASQYIRLGVKEANLFKEYVEEMSEDELRDFKARIEGKTLMLFDDGSYSGKQISEHVQELTDFCFKKRLCPKCIAVVIPFRTAFANTCLDECRKMIPKSSRIQIIVSACQLIPVLADLSPRTQNLVFDIFYNKEKEVQVEAKAAPKKKVASAADKKASAKNRDAVAVYKAKLSASKEVADKTILEKLGTIWFEFKVPNSQSLPKFLVEGSLCDRRGRIIEEAYPLIPKFETCYSNTEKAVQVDLDNFHDVGKRGLIFRGAQPTEEGIRKLKAEYNILTIINLRDKKEIAHSAEIEREGMDLKHIPMNWQTPSIDQAEEFVTFALHQIKHKRPFFVHCYRGAERTGAMIAILKLVLRWGNSEDEGTTAEEFEDFKQKTLEDMKQKGFHEPDHQRLYKMVANLTLGNVRLMYAKSMSKSDAS